MGKYTSDEKLEAVQRYLNGNDGYRSLAKILGMDSKLLHYWIKTYKYHGVEAFSKSYTNYLAVFKLGVLNFINNYGTSVRETAAIFNLSTPALLLKWKKQMETKGVDALESKKRGRLPMKRKNQQKAKKQQPTKDTVEALQGELERLRMENVYLKKLNALVQNKEKTQNKAQVVFELRLEFPVKSLLKLASIPRSTYYYWVKTFGRPDKDTELKTLIEAIYHEHKGRYGYAGFRRN